VLGLIKPSNLLLVNLGKLGDPIGWPVWPNPGPNPARLRVGFDTREPNPTQPVPKRKSDKPEEADDPEPDILILRQPETRLINYN